MDHVIGFVGKGVSTTIAVTSELVAGQRGKESKEARAKAKQEEKDGGSEGGSENLTDQAWELDEAVESPGAEVSEATEIQQVVASSHVDANFVPRPLPMPVIVPQRRPRAQQRGFIRAYAPVLGEYSGISQDQFLNFLTTWSVESQASPIFNVINLAAFATGFIPGVIPQVVSTAVITASVTAQQIQGRYRFNKYLDKANDELFRPKGLIAMVMAYKPEMADDAILQADTTDATKMALKQVLDMEKKNKIRQTIYKLRTESGVAHGDSQIPDFAPLIYPSLDKALISATPEKSMIKQNAVTVQDYFDRRAQADFLAQNPNSRLAQALPPQQKPFVNRYCDPNHPVNNGSLFALLTGGTFDPIGAGRVHRAQLKAKAHGEPPLTEQEKYDALMGRKVRNRVTGTPSKTIPILGKLLKKDVLYLVITNLPSAEEFHRVEAGFAEAGFTGHTSAGITQPQ